jgi:hypothetical protein
MWKAKFTAKLRQAANRRAWLILAHGAVRDAGELEFKIQFAGSKGYTSLVSTHEMMSGEKYDQEVMALYRVLARICDFRPRSSRTAG